MRIDHRHTFILRRRSSLSNVGMILKWREGLNRVKVEKYHSNQNEHPLHVLFYMLRFLV